MKNNRYENEPDQTVWETKATWAGPDPLACCIQPCMDYQFWNIFAKKKILFKCAKRNKLVNFLKALSPFKLSPPPSFLLQGNISCPLLGSWVWLPSFTPGPLHPFLENGRCPLPTSTWPLPHNHRGQRSCLNVVKRKEWERKPEEQKFLE